LPSVNSFNLDSEVLPPLLPNPGDQSNSKTLPSSGTQDLTKSPNLPSLLLPLPQTYEDHPQLLPGTPLIIGGMLSQETSADGTDFKLKLNKDNSHLRHDATHVVAAPLTADAGYQAKTCLSS